MNATRRKKITKLSEQLSDLLESLQTIQEEEENARDGIPESMWESERYERAEAACDCLEEATDALQEVLEKLEEAIES